MAVAMRLVMLSARSIALILATACSGCNPMWGIDALRFDGDASTPADVAGGGAGGGGADGETIASDGGAGGSEELLDGGILWAEVFGDTGDQSVGDVAVTGDGAIQLVGSVRGQIDFGVGGSVAALSEDLFWAELDANGCVLGEESFPYAGDQWGDRLALGPDGARALSGGYGAYLTFGSSTLFSNVERAFLAVHRPDGGYASAVDLEALPDGAALHGVAFDADGNVVVAGTYEGSFGSTGWDFVPCDEPPEIYLAKWAPDGSLVWVTELCGDGDDDVGDVAVAPTGEVIVVGRTSGALALGDGETSIVATAEYDAFVASFDGATGAPVWARQLSGPMLDRANAVAVGSGGDIVVVGSFQGSLDVDGGPAVTGGDAAGDAFVLKLDPAGEPLWCHGIVGDGEVAAHDVGIGGDGRVVVSGRADGSFSFAGKELVSSGGYDLFVVKLDDDGAELWGRIIGDPSEQQAPSLALLPDGSTVIAGAFRGAVQLDGVGGTIPLQSSAGSLDVFVAALRP